MKKTTLSLIMAGALAAGGMAQAGPYDTPAQVGEAGTTVLGAGPTTVMVPMEHYTVVQPGFRDTYRERHQAAATFNTPRSPPLSNSTRSPSEPT